MILVWMKIAEKIQYNGLISIQDENDDLRKLRKNNLTSIQDEKILELMMVKHEDEKAGMREKQLREEQWEKQKKEEEAVRLASEMRRRRLLAEENRIQQLKRVCQISDWFMSKQNFAANQILLKKYFFRKFS